MAKDPAFLFYSKDWIEGTAEMLPEEKGVYIDLLAQQHQTGSLPADTRRLSMIARLSHDAFLSIWNNGLKDKFIEKDGRMVNRKLTEVMTERSDKGRKNKIIGKFATLIRQHKLTAEQKEIIKNEFNVDQFLILSTDLATERLTEWFINRLKSIGNENGDANVFVEGKEKGAEKGKPKIDPGMPIPPNVLEAAEQNQWTFMQARNTEFIKGIWKTFLMERVNDPPEKRLPYERNPSELYQYFLNWSRNKFPKANGNISKQNGSAVPKAGRSEINDRARSNY